MSQRSGIWGLVTPVQLDTNCPRNESCEDFVFTPPQIKALSATNTTILLINLKSVLVIAWYYLCGAAMNTRD